MQVERFMTPDPACCTPDSSVEHVAQLMRDRDVGAIPVVDGLSSLRPVGIVTDRDIVIRAVAHGRNPIGLAARDCMTHHVVTVPRTATIENCTRTMEHHAIRRLVVVDERGRCCGILAQADVAERARAGVALHLLREVSRPHHLPAVH